MNLKGVDALSSVQSDYISIPTKFDYMTSWDPFQHELSYDPKSYFVL